MTTTPDPGTTGEVRVLDYEPGKTPVELALRPDPQAFSTLIGGYYESLGLPGDLAIYYNEAGNDGVLPANKLGIYGTFVVVARDALQQLRSLTDEEIARAERWIEANARTDVRH